MSTATTSLRRRDGIRLLTAARAVAAALLAIFITFSSDHSPMLGLIVLGVFQLVQAAIVAAGFKAAARSSTGRALIAARAGFGVLIGVLALAFPHNGLPFLELLMISGYLVLGVLEVLQAIRRADAGPWSKDGIAVGGLTTLVGAMLVLLPPDSVFTVGLLGAWGAVVAVYLGIAAASMHAPASGVEQ